MAIYFIIQTSSYSSLLCPSYHPPRLSLPSVSELAYLNIQNSEQHIWSQSSAFSLYHISCFPLIHSIGLELRFLSVRCNTIGRCGQEFSLMPVKDKLVSVQWDARHTHARKASSVWGLKFCLFPTLLSFILLISFAPLTCCRMLSRAL